MFGRLDAYGTDDPDFAEGHPEDRCPLCSWPVCDHPGQPRIGRPPRAKWPHRRAAAAELAAQWFDRVLARWFR